MSNNSRWIEKIIDNRKIVTHLLFVLVGLLLGGILIMSGVVKYFPPVNPYGYILSDNKANFIFVFGITLIALSLYIGTRNTPETAQLVKIRTNDMYLRQYLLARRRAKDDARDKLDVLSTAKSVTNISYLLNETASELLLLRYLSEDLLLLLAKEDDPIIGIEIVEIIGKIKIPDIENVLKGCYRKKHPDLKIASVKALGELRTTNAEKYLRKLLKAPHKLDPRLLQAINISLRKHLIPYEYTMLLKKQLFDKRIVQNIREIYIRSALENLGTEEAIRITKAYQLSKMEGLDADIAYKQILAQSLEDN